MDDDVNEAESVAIGAYVLSKRMDKVYVGRAETATYQPLFYVTFETDDGKFFAFEDGEDVE